MAVSKMQMVNIVGIISEFDKVVEKHLIDKDIHIENSLEVLEDTDKIYAFDENNSNEETRRKIFSLLQIGKIDVGNNKECSTAPVEDIIKELERIERRIEPFQQEKSEIDKKLLNDKTILRQLEPVVGIDIDLTKLFKFEFVQYRFGKMPKTNFQNLQNYLDDMEALFITTRVDNEYVWGMYFVAQALAEKIDQVFMSLNFERVAIPWDVYGTPLAAFKGISARDERFRARLKDLDTLIKATLIEERNLLITMYNRMCDIKRSQEVKKNSAHTREAFCISGWMQEDTVSVLEKSLQSEENLVFITEPPEEVAKVNPPTKMKNNPLVKPFEFFINMYGLPGYKEFDPTVIVAITYSLIFGAMFGDLGQGFVVALCGFLFAIIKKNQFGYVMGILGLSSMFFGGVVYGSIFGIEDVYIHGLVSPMNEINNVLIYSVILGVSLLTLSMIVNIYNGIKNKNVRSAVFAQNGLAGFILYWSIILIGIQMIVRGRSVSLWLILVCILVPVLLIMLQEPLAHKLEHRKDWLPEEKGMFFVEAAFDVYEVLLAFLSNTMSFLRVGAYALSHVGLMSVVFSMSKMAGSSGSLLVIIFGNLFVIVVEGFLAGIQVLRLEFYEIFSRFYAGDGKEFKPLKNIKIND